MPGRAYWPDSSVEAVNALSWSNTASAITDSLSGLKQQVDQLTTATLPPLPNLPSLDDLTQRWFPSSDQAPQSQSDQAAGGSFATVPDTAPGPLQRALKPLQDLTAGWGTSATPSAGVYPDAGGVVQTRQPAPSGAAMTTPAEMPTAQPAIEQPASSAPAAPAALPDRLDTSSREANLRQWAPALQDLERRTGLRADALAAIIQAENGGGQSPLSANDQNYFSITAVPGRPYQAGVGTGGRFAHYNSPQDSLNDFVDLIQKHYPEAWANRSDPQKFFQGLVKGGYIVPEPGFPVETWLTNLENGRQHFNQLAPAAPPPPANTPGPDLSPNGTPITAPSQGQPRGPYSGTYTQQSLANAGDPDAWAKCGPVAAYQFALRTGRQPTPAEVERLAKDAGWTPQRGMAGLQSESKLLASMGISARAENGVDWDKVITDVSRGNPVILQLPGHEGHYITAQGYDPKTGKIDFGSTVGDLRAAGHKTQFTPQELEGLGWGTPTASLYLDNPGSPAPSAVAGNSGASSITPPRPDASGAAASVTAPTAASMTDRMATPSGQPTMYRQPLGMQATTDTRQASDREPREPLPPWPPVSTPGQPYDTGDVMHPAPSYPMDTRPPGAQPGDVTDSEGVDRSLDPLLPPWQDHPPFVTNPYAVPPGTMYRQPLGPATAGSDTFPTDQQPPAAQAIPNEDPTATPRPAYVAPAEPIMATPPPADTGATPPASPYDPQQVASMESAPDRFSAPSESPLKPLYDLGGQVIGYVHAGLDAVDRSINAPVAPPGSPQARALQTVGINPNALPAGGPFGAAERTVRDLPAHLASLPAANQQAVKETADAIVQSARATGQDIQQGNVLAAVGDGLMTGLNAVNALYAPLARDVDHLLPDFGVGPLGAGDIALNTSVPHDVVNLARSAGQLVANGVKATPKVLAALRNGVPVDDILQRAAGAIDTGIGAERATGLTRSTANALPDAADAVPSTVAAPSGVATQAATIAAPVRGAVGAGVGAVTGGAAGYESAPEDATTGDRVASTALGAGAGALAGATLAGAGTLAAGRLVDSLVQSGRLDARVLATHPEFPERVRAMFAVAAEGLPDQAVVPVPPMVTAMVRLRPKLAEQVADLLGGSVTAGQVRQLVGAADSPGVAQTARDMVVDALTGLGNRGRRQQELGADAATVQGIAAEAAQRTRGRASESTPILDTRNGPARLVDETTAPNLTGFVNDIADNLGVARPGVYVSPATSINASATANGRAPALIVTRGLLDANLTDDEMAAVLTHELAHTAQDTRSVVGRAFGAVRDAVSSGTQETANVLPGGGQPPANPSTSSGQALPPQVQRAVQQAQAQQQRRGVSAMDWIRTLGNSGIFGPISASVNVGGALTNAALSIPKEFTRAAVRGQPAEFMPMALATFRAIPEQFAGLLHAALDSNPASISARVGNLPAKALAYTIERPAAVLMGAPDAFFRPMFDNQGMYREAGQIATSQGLKGNAWWRAVEDGVTQAQAARAGQLPTNPQVAGQISAAGKAYADRMLFQGQIQGIGKEVQNLANHDGLAGVIGNLILPFTGTPYHVAMRTIENIPGSAAVGRFRGQQPTRFDAVYDQMAGAVIAGGLMYVASQARLTGSGPDDPEKRQQMISQGWSPHAVAIGGTPSPNDPNIITGAVYVPTRLFGQYQPILDAAGETHDSLAYEKPGTTPGRRVGDMIHRIAGSRGVLTNMVWLQGITDILSMTDAQDPSSGLPNYLARTMLRYTPGAGIVRAVATAEDPLQRRPSRSADVGASEAFRQSVAQSVPGVLGAISPIGTREGLRPGLDVLGRPAVNPQQRLAAIGPRMTTGQQDPVINAFEQAGVDIPRPKTAVTYIDTPIDLTPEEQDAWSTARGDYLSRVMTPLVQNGSLDRLPAARRQERLKDLLSQASDVADRAVLRTLSPADRIQRRRDAITTKKAS